MHPGAGSGAACALGAGVATGPVTCRDGQGLWAAVPLGKGAGGVESHPLCQEVSSYS